MTKKAGTQDKTIHFRVKVRGNPKEINVIQCNVIQVSVWCACETSDSGSHCEKAKVFLLEDTSNNF